MHSSLVDLAPVRWSKTLMKKVWNRYNDITIKFVASNTEITRSKDLHFTRNIPFLLHILISPVVRNQPIQY